MTAQLGDRVRPGDPLAVSQTRLGPMSRGFVLSATRVRRWGAPPAAPIDVFNDAVDLARRALLDGSNVSQDLAVDLLAECYTAYHDAYALYGLDG
jgi:hypothetical protein